MTTIIDGTSGITYPVTAGGTSAIQASSAKVLQVVQGVVTSVVTTSTPTIGTFVAISGFTASITPSSSSSKILVIVDANVTTSASTDQGLMYQLTRNGTAIDLGDSAGSRSRVTGVAPQLGFDYAMAKASVSFLDSPATTSSTTYGLSVCATSSSRSIYLNRTTADADFNYSGRAASTITLLEISA
jgi:hypothetical protein